MAEQRYPSARRVAVRWICLATAIGTWSAAVRADHDPCPHPPGWVPQDLDRIIEAHRVWMIQLGFVRLGPDDPEPTVEADAGILCRADLRGADLSQAYLVEVDFREADLSGADLSDANMIAADLSGARLVGARMDRANLFMANLRDADLTGASLREAHMPRTKMNGATLDGADMTGVTD